MGLISELLLLPVTGPVHELQFIREQIREEAEAERLDEDRVMAELMKLGLCYDLGEISDDEYVAQERALLEELDAIRAYKERLMELDTDTYVDGDESYTDGDEW
jgi:hypothetical protein